MSPNRRDFIKFVVAGSVAAGCPVDFRSLRRKPASPTVDSEDNRICHQVRDGKVFARPPVSASHDVVIVGGGVSGLTRLTFCVSAISCCWKRNRMGRKRLSDGVPGKRLRNRLGVLTRTNPPTLSPKKSAWSLCRSTIGMARSSTANLFRTHGEMASTSSRILRPSAKASRNSGKKFWPSIFRNAHTGTIQRSPVGFPEGISGRDKTMVGHLRPIRTGAHQRGHSRSHGYL